MAQNVEIKLRVSNIKAIEKRCKQLEQSQDSILLNQIDIYYRVKNGRLKMRLINGRRAELIAYKRPNEAKARISSYHVFKVRLPRVVDRQLRLKYGYRCTVSKKRRVYFYQNTRIHLDTVKGLGSFVEFEYIISPDYPADKGLEMLEFLSQELNIQQAIVCKSSYVDLMESKA